MGKTLIKGAFLVDPAEELPRPLKKDLLIENGRISEIADTLDTAADEIIHADNLWIVPGFIGWNIDLFNHDTRSLTFQIRTALEKSEKLLQAGMTTAVCSGGVDFIDLELRDLFSSGRAAGPRLLACGLPLTPVPYEEDQQIYQTGICGPDSARRTAREWIKAGVDYLLVAIDSTYQTAGKTCTTHLDVAEISEVVQQGRQAGLVTCARASTFQSLQMAVEAGIHLILYPAHLQENDAEQLRGRNISLVLSDAKSIRYARQAGLAVFSSSSEDKASNALAVEIENLTLAGFSPYEALQCFTIQAARALQVQRDLGTLMPGAQANLLMLTANPVENAHNLRCVHGVVKAGRPVVWRKEVAL